MRQTIGPGSTLEGVNLIAGNKFSGLSQQLGGQLTLDADMPHMLHLDPDGSGRDVLLPAEEKGLWFLIANTADSSGETLTVKEDGDVTTIATLGQDEIGLFFCGENGDGTLEWRALTPSGVGDSLAVNDVTLSELIFSSGATGINSDSGTATASSSAATVNNMAGKVTTEALTTAADAAETLTITDDKVAAADMVFCSVANGTNSQGIPIVGLVTPAAGSFTVAVYNLHASQALNGTLVVSFLVVKA